MAKTLVEAHLYRPAPNDDIDAKGYIEARPSLRRDIDGIDGTVLPAKFTAKLGAALTYTDNSNVEQTAPATPGVAWLWVDATDAGAAANLWFWTFTERTDGGSRRYCTVPTSAVTVDYRDLPDINPDDYTATAPAGTPAFAVADAVLRADLEAQIAAVESGDVDSVAGLSGTVTDAALKTALNLPADTEQAIADETARATTAEGLLDGRLDTAEADLAGRLSDATLAATYGRVGAWTKSKAYAVGDLVVTALGDRLRCVTAHTSSATVLTDDLPKWTPVDTPQEEALLLQRARASKGGTIGVGSTVKAVVALRFDDDHEAFSSTIYPLLKARGLPAGHASISDLTSQSWSDGDSAANVLTRFKNGVEVWSHGLDHNDPSPHDLTGAGGLYDQIVGSKATIESWGVKCQGWMQPGATPLGSATPYGTDGTTAGGFYSAYSTHLLRRTYALSESYAGGGYRNIPHGLFHGQDHVTISEGVSLAAAQSVLDIAIRERTGIEFMAHSGNLGLAGNMSVADFTTFLDYIVTKWDAGLIDVVTPSGLFFVDRTDQRIQLISDPSFDVSGEWTAMGTSTIQTSGGHTGSNFLRVTDGSLPTAKRPGRLKAKFLDGETFLFEGWARSAGASTTVSRVLIQSYTDTTPLNLSLTKSGIPNTGWTRVRHAFSVPPGVDELVIAVGRNSGDTIDWDDITVKKV